MTFEYNLVLLTYGSHYLVTMMFVDGKEKKNFRTITGNTYYQANSRRSSVFMEKGNHNAYINYYSSSCINFDPAWDWSNAEFKITYFKK